MSFLSEFSFDVILNCSYPFSNIFTLKQFLFLGVFALAIFLYSFFPYLKKYKLGIVAVLLIIFGGLTNGVERLSTGCVRDYFNLFNLFRFNVADLLVNAGILLSVYIIWKKK